MKISATRRLAVNRTEAGKSDTYTITKGACEMSTKVKIEIRDRIRELRRVPASHLMPHVKNSVLAETGPKTFNLDVAAEVQATLVISKCVWCGVSFVQSCEANWFNQCPVPQPQSKTSMRISEARKMPSAASTPL